MNIVNKYFKLFSTIQMMGLSHEEKHMQDIIASCKISFL